MAKLVVAEIYYEGTPTDELGWLLGGEADRGYFAAVRSTELLLHDILEHTPAQSVSDVADEIMALGAMQFIRGGNYTSPRDGRLYEYEVMSTILAGVLHQFKDCLPSPFYNESLPFYPAFSTPLLSLGKKVDASLTRIADIGVCRFLFNFQERSSCSSPLALWAKYYLKKGYTLARERYPGSSRRFLAANFMEMVENAAFVEFVEVQELTLGDEYLLDIDLETRTIQWSKL